MQRVLPLPSRAPSLSKGVVLPGSSTIKPVGNCLRHCANSSPVQYYEIGFDASPHAAEYTSFYVWPLFSFQIYPGSGAQHVLLTPAIG